LGSIPDFGSPPYGVRFSNVHEASSAPKAGLKAGDVLVEFDGKPIDINTTSLTLWSAQTRTTILDGDVDFPASPAILCNQVVRVKYRCALTGARELADGETTHLNAVYR